MFYLNSILRRQKDVFAHLTVLLHIVNFLALGYPLQIMQNSQNMVSLPYCSISGLWIPYLLRIDQFSFPLYGALAGVSLVTLCISLLTRNKKRKSLFETITAHFVYVFQTLQATVFLPYLEIRLAKGQFARIFLWLVIEVYVYTVYVVSRSFSISKNDLVSINKQTYVFIGIVIDVNVVLSSALLNVYFSFFISLVSSTMVLVAMLTQDQVFGNYVVDQILTSVALYFFTACIIISVYLFGQVQSGFLKVFVIIEIVVEIVYNVLSFWVRAKKITKIAKNIQYLENVATSLRENIKRNAFQNKMLSNLLPTSKYSNS